MIRVDDIKQDKICPHCNISLLDGLHKVSKLKVNDYYNYIIECPRHPSGAFMIGPFKE